jgi:hypothetical protein
MRRYKMREIKFRGKDIKTRQWVYGYYFQGFTGISYILVMHDHILRMTEMYEVDPSTIGQYTGLKDKNGKEIYEGDILSNGNGKKSVMEWCKNLAAFECEPGDSIIFAPFNWDKCEIIGTIHDQKAEVKHEH